ncbi:methyltransferase domain-containing protein [Pseudonocardia sp. DSM 110487]|uniref:methyltransferase domain-containing protein n=1 Tax=Pseudonocardia sp. DSM 110487 TaxID=2865833 RepID=UPI001C695A24|nr:methyltransferase domain-containing protein [Pseudonocardia sp. DSM 110487]QYN34741.1 methyltransferase domain-containing protein [Pseudonocardia sp. DSM 110487]
MTAARLVARCVRGIEEVLAEEVCGLGTVQAVGHREVRFTARADPAVLGLTTADDVFVIAAEAGGIGRARADLNRLRCAVAAADLERALRDRERCGGMPGVPTLDVSASVLGRRAFNRYDLEDAAGTVLARRLGLPYRSRRADARPPAGGLSWRLTVVDDRVTVALRIPGRPLHRRSYKAASVPGTLHPPLAAAILRVAEIGAGHVVLDPCCGAGTLPIEAAGTGARVVGSDVDPAAVAAAVANGADLPVTWSVADAGALPLRDDTVDRVVVNPPWARQVVPRGRLAAHPHRLWREVSRVLAPSGRIVALLPDRHPPAGLLAERTIPVSLFGSHPVITVLRPG